MAVVEVVPVAVGVLAVGGVVAPVEASEVVGDAEEVVDGRDSLLFAIHLDVLLDVEALEGEVNRLGHLLLLANLGIGEVKEAGSARVGRLLALEALDLDHEDLGRPVQLQFLVDVAVLLALAAVPLVRACEHLLLAELAEAAVEGEGAGRGRILAASIDEVLLKPLVVGLALMVDHDLEDEVAPLVHLEVEVFEADLLDALLP
mmetsp:Transcript_1956/g.3407  ORF Transcript_1956/g.3407 Transcript_1956/m.3407 type:complete len:203 (-) Transcript_1956:2500-3108(-)